MIENNALLIEGELYEKQTRKEYGRSVYKLNFLEEHTNPQENIFKPPRLGDYWVAADRVLYRAI